MTTSVPRRSRLHDAKQAIRPDHPGERRLESEQVDAGARALQAWRDDVREKLRQSNWVEPA